MGNQITKLLAYAFIGAGIALICKGTNINFEYGVYISLILAVCIEVGVKIYNDHFRSSK